MIGNVMKPVRKRFSAILVFIFGFSISVALAQSASQKQFVSASGGGASASANFEARGVIGESVSGPSGNANYAGKSGFYDKSVAPGIGLLRVTPDFNSIALPSTAQFEITFETALEPGTVNSNNVFVFGSQTGSMPAAITLVNDDSTIKIITDSEFGYGENVTVVVTKNVSSSAGDNLDQSVILNYDIATLDGPSENPALHSPEMISFGNSPTMVAIGDINGDGNSDVVIALTGEDRLSWHAGDGTGNFGPAQDIQGFVDVKFLSLADAEGDGDLDIYAGNDTDIKIINNEVGLGTSWLLDWENDESLMEEMTVLLNIDFNGDGIMDFITDYSDDSGSDGTVFWAGLPADANKNGRIAQRLMDFNKTTTRNYTAFAVGDVDRDGDLDLVSAFTNSSGNHKIKWRPNINDDDTFPFASSLNDIVTVADRINHIEAGDFNNDGWLDIIYWLANNTLHAVYYNPDNGNWDSFELADDLNAMNHMAAGDLNNDGNLDLLMVFNKEFKWLSNTGVTNGFGEANSLFVTPAGSPEIFHFALGDLDGDADADVVFTDRSNDNISWLTSGAVVVPNTQPDIGSGPGVDHVVTFDVPMSATRPLLFAEPVDADGDVMTITVTAIPDPAQGIVHLSSQLPVDKSRIGAKVEDVIVPLAVGDSIDPLDLSGLEFTASPGFTGAVDDFEFVITDGKGIIKNIHDGTIQMTWLDQYAEVYRASGQATSSGVNFACRMADDRDVIIQVRNGSSDIRDWTLQKVGGVTIDIADLEMQPNEIVYVNAGPYDGQNATFRLVGDNAPGGTTTAGAGDLKLAEDMVGTAVVTVTSAITVTSNADSGPGSLREAIENANTDPGPDTVRFAAIFDWGNNPIVLQSALPNINDDGTYINGDIDDDGLPDVLLDGGGVVSRGLGVNADDIKIRGLAFVNFTSSAISFGGNSKNLWIVGNHLGVGLDGNTAGSNNGDHGISGSWFESVHIGDGTVKGRNVISGHTKDGISISNIDSTFIFGNIVGLGRTNDTAIPNTWHGISLDNGINYAEIGNGTATGRNIISGNGQLGVYIDQPTDVTIKGNYFGTNVAGLANRDNGWGSLFFRDGFNVVIGDSTQLGRNVMAGTCDVYNEGLITFHSMDSTRIFGNFIGVGADGETPLYVKRGIYVEYSNSRVSIGGHRPMERNVIANAEEDGIKLFRADSVIIQGNYIGVDSTGTIARGNAENGIFIADESSNARVFENIIANNGQSGIRVSSAEADSNTFVENYIYDNTGPGIFIDAGSQQNIAAPVLLFVDESEILFGQADPNSLVRVYADFGTQARFFVGSVSTLGTGEWSIPLNKGTWPEAYTNLTATQDVNNSTSAFAAAIASSPTDPLLVTNNTDDNSIGTLRFAINFANSNSGPDSIYFEDTFDWLNNPIALQSDLPAITDDSTKINGDVDGDGLPNVIITDPTAGSLGNGISIRSAHNDIRGLVINSFLGGEGILVDSDDAHDNLIAGNYIGTNSDGSAAQSNQIGIQIVNGAYANTIGGSGPGAGNIISGNNYGVIISGSVGLDTRDNDVINNIIGLNKAGDATLGNNLYGIYLQRTSGNEITQRNVIAGSIAGIHIIGEADKISTGNIITDNYIGTDTSGTASRPNTIGIFISEHSTGNFIGDGSFNGGNLISGNTSNGIYIERGGDQTSILGNIIGLSSNGVDPLPNGSNGIEIQGNARDILDLTIGNGTPDGRNVIAANNDWNLKIFKTDNCNIYGNYIGTDTDGNTRINNEGAIQFRNSINSLIQGNVIGGFDRWGGLYLADNDSLIISANRIGIGADGASDISAVDGILVASEPEGINLIRGEKTHIGTGEISNANYIGNFYKGIVVGADAGVTNIAGNVIGLEADGETAASNNFGLVIHSDGNHINRNVISANESYGVQIFSNNNIVIRNTVGPVLSGNAPVTGANQSIGLMLWDAGSNQIGGNNYTDANIFADNQNGLAISGGNNNTVTYNRFGIGFDGTTPLPNSGNGIRIYRTANGNLLAHNQIVGSGDNGIWVDGINDAKNNNFNVNSIFANNSGGIEIINGGQNGVVSPIINQINSDSLLSGVAAPEALVLLYADELNQGELFLDSVRADINGDWIYKVGLDTIPGRYVSFTALQDSFGNTSAFSAPLQINLPPVINNKLGEFSADEDFAGPFSWVLDNAYYEDPEAGQLNFTIVEAPDVLDATLTGGMPEVLQVTSLQNAFGIDTLILEIADDQGLVITDSLFITIAAINDQPVVDAAIGNLALDEDFDSPHVVVVDLNNIFSDPESQALSFSASSDDESVVTVNVDGNKLELNAVADASGSAIITVTADDGAAVNNTVSTSFTVTIDAVNDAPVVVNPIAAVTLNEDFASPYEVVADLNANFSDPESQALSFSASSDDESVVTVNVDGNKLELNAVADASGSAIITVTADDGAAVNNTVSTSFTMTIDAVNDAPVVVNPIAAVTLNEDFASPHEVVADLNANFSDPEGQALSFSASSDDESVVTVNVDGNKLELNAVADASGSAIITVTADDGAAVNNTVSTSFTVTIDAVNDAPVVVNPIAAVTLNEDFASPHEVVADLNANFSDPESQALSFSASSDDESVVTVNVDGNKLELNAVADASGSAIITVTADDGAAVNNTVSTSFTVTIDAVNDAPVVVNPIAAVTLNEDFASPHEVVADLNANFSDPESQALSFSASSDDESVVTVNVDGDKLELNAVADATGSAIITVTADDGAAVNNTVSTSFTVTIAAENDKPDLTLNMALKNYIEGNAPLVLDNTLTITDVDNGNLQGAVVSISANYTSSEDSLYYGGATFAPVFDLASGTLTFSGGAPLADYVAALRDVRYKNTSDNPVTDERTITFVVNDGNSDSDGESLNVAVTPINDPPVVTLSVANVAYTEAAGPVVLDNGIVISDVDNSDLVDAFIRISGGYVQGEDTLIYSGTTLTPTFDEGNGRLRLNGVATLADYQQALREVSYNNLSANPTAVNRTVEFVLNDGAGVSLAQTMTVTVMPVNNKPVVTVSGVTLAYNENSGPQQLDNTITVADVDNSEFVNATVQISNNYVQGEDNLIYIGASLIPQFDVPSGALILSGRLPKEDFQQILRDTYYENLSDNPNTNDRTVSFVVVDGLGLNSDPGTMQIEITSDNDKPEINLTVATVNYTENDGPEVLDNALTLSDIDDTEIDSAVVTISGNYVPGEDVLSYGGAAFTPVFDPLSGTLTFIVSSPIADYEQALREVRYENTSDDPNTLDRTIAFVVNDGSADSDIKTLTVDLTATNDKPVVTLTPGSIDFQEGDPILPIDAALLVTDIDDAILKSANVWIRNNYIEGEDSLYVVNPLPGITANFVTTTGVLSLEGDATLSDYQDVLRSVGYRNVSADPTLDLRTVSIIVNDPAVASARVDKIITVGTINNPPELLFSSSDTLTYTENDEALLLDGGIVLSDPDTPLLQSAKVKISAGYVEGEDVLEHGLLPIGVLATFDVPNAELRFSGLSGVANYEGLLRTVTFRSVSENPGTDRRRISIEVYDGADFSADTARYVNVVRTNDFPLITTISLDNATQDVAYADTVKATDIDFGDVLTFNALDVPAWMTVNADGSLEGTPVNADVAANVRVQVRVSDGELADTLDVTIDVLNINDAPIISTVALSNATQDVAYADTVKATDADLDALTFAKLSGPAWMTVNADGSIEGVPTNDDTTAAVTIEIEVTDGQGGSDILTTDIAVINVNDAPEITTLSLTNAQQDVAYADTVKATDIDFGDVLTFNALDVPAWMTVKADGSLEGTPSNADVSANVRVQVRVSDGELADTLDVTIDVLNINDAPIISTVALSNATQDVAYADTVKATDADLDALTFAKLSGPAWMTVNADGSIEGVPTNDDTTAAVTIEIEVTDGQGGSDILTTDIAVINVNDAPEITTLSLTNAQQDVAYADTVKATDIDFGDVLTFNALDVPAWMTVNADGSLEGTPVNADVAANVRVQVRVSDGELADTLDVTIDVLNINDAPIISTVALSNATQDVAYADTVKATDADLDALTFAKLSGPAWMTVNADGSIEGVPTNDDTTAAVTIEIEVTDGQGGSDILTTDIAVINVNDAPEITTLSLTNAQQDVAYADTVKATDIDFGDVLTFNALDVPAWMTVKADGSLEGTPSNADVSANVRVQVRVSDGELADTLDVTIDVLNINDAPIISTVALSNATQDVAYADTVKATDADLDALTFAKLSGPAWMTVNADGSIEGVPTNDDTTAAVTIEIEVTDGQGGSDILTTDIAVINVNDAPEITTLSLTNAQQDVAYADTVKATDIDFGDVLTFNALDVPAWMTVKADGSLEGTPSNADVAANVRVQVRVSDGELADTLDVTIDVLNINDAPVISTVALSDATQDVAYADTVKASDADLDDLTFAPVSVPAWMTVNADGSIEGTPANADTTAAVTIKIEVTDGQGGSDTLTTDIAVINVNDAPEITTLSLTNAQQDVAYADTVKATDIDFGDVLTFNALDVPAWMTVKADGSLEGTPSNADVAANVRVQVRVSDGELADTLDVTIDVLNINDAPVISTVALSDATQDVAYADTVKASDADLDALTFAKLSGPAWMTVNADGSIEGTPANADATAAVTIKIEVTDGQGGSDTLTTDIAVLNVNDAPNVINPIADVVIFDTDSDVKLAALADVFSDIDAGDVLSYNVIGNGTVNISTADDTLRISGIEGVGGIDTLLVMATDTGLLSAIDTVIVEVQLSNEAPVLAEFPAFAVNEGESFAAINLNTYVSDANDAKSDLKWEISQEIDLEFVVVDDTTLTVAIPDENWFGSETVRFKVTDPQGASDSSDVSFTVLAVNDAPVLASIDTIRIDEGDPIDPLALAALASDIDDPADSLAWSIETGTQLNASISEGDTLYLSVNDANWSGTETLDLIVSDPSGATDTTLVTVVVNGVNDAPVFSGLAPVSLSEDDSTTITLRDLVEDVDSAPEALVFAATVVAASGSIYSSDDLALRLDDASSELRFVPAANAFGDFRVELSVSDGDGGTAIDTIDVAVSGINDAPQLGSLADTTIFFDQTISLTLMGSDVDGDTLNYSVNNDLTSISGNLLMVSEPGGDARGTHLITVYASDGALLDSTRFTLTIIGDADAPEIQTFEFSEDTSATTLARGFWVNTLAVDTLGGKSGTPSAELRYIYNVTRSADGADLSVELTGSGYYQWTELLPGSYDLAFYVADAKGNGLAEPLYSNTLVVLPAVVQLASETWTMMTLSRDVTSTALLNKLRAGELYRWNGADYGSIPGEILVPGQAFWILTENPAGERFNFETQDPITQDTLKVALNRGWNQVGNPYEMPLRSEFITITANGNADVPLLEAVASEVILSDVFVFTGLTEDLTDIYRLQPIENMIFRPWEGVWIYVNAESAVLTWSKTPVTDIQPLVSSAVLAKREGDAPNRFKVQLEGRSTQVFTVHFTEGPNVKRVPSLGRTGSRLSLSNNLMHYHVADFAEATELRQYGIDVDVKAGDMVTVDFGGSAVAGAYLVFESRREVIELAAGLNVFDSDVQGSGILLLTNDLNFDPDNLPFSAGLSQNYPNPFNITTRIRVAVPLSLHQKDVRLDVYNILGQRVATLLNRKLDSGVRPIEWNGKNTANNVVATGVYFFRMTIAGKQFVKKAVLLK
jgi:phosphoribosylamine-glycine ligase